MPTPNHKTYSSCEHDSRDNKQTETASVEVIGREDVNLYATPDYSHEAQNNQNQTETAVHIFNIGRLFLKGNKKTVTVRS